MSSLYKIRTEDWTDKWQCANFPQWPLEVLWQNILRTQTSFLWIFFSYGLLFVWKNNEGQKITRKKLIPSVTSQLHSRFCVSACSDCLRSDVSVSHSEPEAWWEVALLLMPYGSTNVCNFVYACIGWATTLKWIGLVLPMLLPLPRLFWS